MGNVDTYSDAKVRETGVQGFKTIVEVQPAFRKEYRALRRDLASYARLERKDRESERDFKNLQTLEGRIDEKAEILLGQYLKNAGIEYKERGEIDGEKNVILVESIDNGGISIRSYKCISAFPDDRIAQLFTRYGLELTVSLNKDKEFQMEVQLNEEGSMEIRHVSNALCVLFPKTYNRAGIPAIAYIKPLHVNGPGALRMAPLSRLPRVKEHIQELGKELSPHLQDLEALFSGMKRVSDRNTEMAEKIRHTLKREYLHTLLEAMGRGIE